MQCAVRQPEQASPVIRIHNYLKWLLLDSCRRLQISPYPPAYTIPYYTTPYYTIPYYIIPPSSTATGAPPRYGRGCICSNTIIRFVLACLSEFAFCFYHHSEPQGWLVKALINPSTVGWVVSVLYTFSSVPHVF